MKKFLIIALGGLSVSAFASDLKFAYVNFDTIMKTSTVATTVDANYKTKFTPENNRLQALNQQVMTEFSDYKKLDPKKDKKKADELKADELKARIEKNQASLQNSYTAFQQQLQETQQVEVAIISAKVNEIVKDLSTKEDYDVVLSANQLVYAKNKFDITDQVLAKFDKVNSDDIIKQIDTKVAQANQQQSAQNIAAAPTASK